MEARDIGEENCEISFQSWAEQWLRMSCVLSVCAVWLVGQSNGVVGDTAGLQAFQRAGPAP